MMTGEQYRASLRDGRKVYCQGRQVDRRHHRSADAAVGRLGGRRLRPALPARRRRRAVLLHPPLHRGAARERGAAEDLGLPDDLHVERPADAAQRLEPDGRRPPGLRRAGPRLLRGLQAARHPRGAHDHRRQGRPREVAVAAGRPRPLRPHRRPPARRRRHPGRQDAHLLLGRGPRADRHADEADEARRGGLRGRLRGADERPRRHDHQHDVHAPARLRRALLPLQPRPRHDRGVRRLRRRLRPQRAGVPGGRGRALGDVRPLPRPVGAARQRRQLRRRRRHDGRAGAAGQRGERHRADPPHQGQDRRDGRLRDDDPRRVRGRDLELDVHARRATPHPTSCSPTPPSTTRPGSSRSWSATSTTSPAARC